MKKRLLLASAALLLSSLAWAQKPDFKAELRADTLRTYGGDYPYPERVHALTPAPKGYKPFYISHYGRHGSRYYWGPGLYHRLDTILIEAHEKGALNQAGEKFYAKYMEIYPELVHGWGELTPLGYEQHERIARTIYKTYPDIFGKGGHVSATASLSGRAVISMAAFCQALAGCNPNLDIYQRSSRETLDITAPDERENPYLKEYPEVEFPMDIREVFADLKPGRNVFVEEFFSDVGKMKRSPRAINADMFSFFTTLPSIGYVGIMGNPVNFDDLYAHWEETNRNNYMYYWSAQNIVIPIVEDIIQRADDVIEGRSNDIAALRFGHDSYLGPLNVLLGLDGADKVPANPADIGTVYQNYRTGMAGNIQLVFYRSSKSDEILVKALLCGEEVTLPLPSDMHPYYRWSDFKSHFTAVCDKVKSSMR
jgi:hypothetical protein